MIRITGLKKFYGDNLVLNKINIDISSPGLYIIAGASGSGKTTLINIIGLMEDSFEGDYFFFDKNIKNINNKEKELLRYNQISYIYQNPKFLENESIKVNLEIALNKKINKREIKEYLTRVNLHINYKKKISTCSGGERKRISILIAILKNTPLILADEITVSLDEENKKMVMDLLLEMSKNKVIILVTHDISFIKKYKKDIYYLKDRTLAIKNTTEKTYENDEKKNNKLSKKFIKGHVLNHIKNKTGRTLISTLCLVIALVSFGFSTLLTSSLSDGSEIVSSLVVVGFSGLSVVSPLSPFSGSSPPSVPVLMLKTTFVFSTTISPASLLCFTTVPSGFVELTFLIL